MFLDVARELFPQVIFLLGVVLQQVLLEILQRKLGIDGHHVRPDADDGIHRLATFEPC